MTIRREQGTGSIYQGSDGAWHAAVMILGGKQMRRQRWSREDAEVALAELMVLYADQVGYHYHARKSGIRRPDLLGYRSHYPRKGVTIRVRFLVFDRDGYRCVYCGATPADARLVIDHVQPIADGGTDDLSNLATACKPCNAGKAGRPLRNLPATVAARIAG